MQAGRSLRYLHYNERPAIATPCSRVWPQQHVVRNRLTNPDRRAPSLAQRLDEKPGTELRADLSTLRGPIVLSGQGAWPIGARPAFLATASMPTALQPQLAPFLRLIAAERADGSFELQVH